MESLYRKYRPQTFSDVVGQQHVVGTLERAVLEGRTSHAYLFCGPRGTGKTTMARLLAKALMCEQGAGHLPDGTCNQCMLIAAGEHPDVYELDAASRTGVDNVREEIINRVGYAPVQGRYKVYIIDEVHMLTTAAFNALLKTLEEPPGHVVFVLCTTDPQKIPATILSRVQRFDFRPIGNDDIQARLAYVCEQEGFTYEDAALELVVRNARGGMRDALSSLEQLSVFGSGVIGLEAAQDMLGAAPGTELQQVVAAIASRDVASLFSQVGQLVDAGRDLLQVTRELAAHMRDVYVAAAVGCDPSVLPGISDPVGLQAEASSFGSVDRIARILTLLGDVSREMSTAPNQRLVFEIACTRMARPETDLTLESLAERVADLERQLEAGAPSQSALLTNAAVAGVAEQGERRPREAATDVDAQGIPDVPATHPLYPSANAQSSAELQAQPMPAAPRPEMPVHQPVQAPHQAVEVSRQTPRPTHAAQSAMREPQAAAARPATQAPTSQTPAAQVAPVSQAPAAQAAGITDSGALQRAWRQVVSELTKRLPSRGSLLSSAVATSDDGNELVVCLPKGSGFALKMLERLDIRSAVEGVVAEVFGPRTLTFREGLASDLQLSARKDPVAPAPQARQWQSDGQYASSSQVPNARTSAPQVPPAQSPDPHAQTFVGSQQPRSQRVSSPSQPAEYPMPWDAPASEPAFETSTTPESYEAYEAVPYEELSSPAFALDEPNEPAETPAMPAQSASRPVPSTTPVAPEPSASQSSRQPSWSAQSSSVSQHQAPRPDRQMPQSERPSAQTVTEAPSTTSFDREIPDDLPPELSAILENAFEVFGSDVRVSRDS